jgi:hypothetical protein
VAVTKDTLFEASIFLTLANASDLISVRGNNVFFYRFVAKNEEAKNTKERKSQQLSSKIRVFHMLKTQRYAVLYCTVSQNLNVKKYPFLSSLL